MELLIYFTEINLMLLVLYIAICKIISDFIAVFSLSQVFIIYLYRSRDDVDFQFLKLDKSLFITLPRRDGRYRCIGYNRAYAN